MGSSRKQEAINQPDYFPYGHWTKVLPATESVLIPMCSAPPVLRVRQAVSQAAHIVLQQRNLFSCLLCSLLCLCLQQGVLRCLRSEKEQKQV